MAVEKVTTYKLKGSRVTLEALRSFVKTLDHLAPETVVFVQGDSHAPSAIYVNETTRL